ncbi:MAG TPA: STAS domain-containing protein [Acidimicrobiales bacterium]|nr:STAS domain-containing protein [Acidimicrobiales bacterium]
MTEEYETGLMAVDPLDVHAQLGQEWAVVNVRGELDILTSPDLAAILDAVRQNRRQVAVDLAGVRFVDAHGLRVLVEAARTMLDRGQFIITCPTPLFRRLLAITGLESEMKLLDQRPIVSGYHNPLRF